jgi:phytoene/squalene synthetase
VARWASWAELRRYCALSADPVGRIVLDLFGVRDAAAAARSDDVCTALQLLEHCQDVREDYLDRDRVYLPADEMLRFGVTEADLGADSASPQLRRLLAFEVDRAERLLASGPVLVRGLNGWARVAVAGYVAGGLATVAALRRAGYDVLAARVRPRKADVVRRALALVVPRPAAGGAVWPPGAGDRR